MSTDWIKMRVDLRTHPKVVRMASALKADKLRVIGGLFSVWSIFDAHSADGVLDGYTFAALDDELHWKGFAKAMSDIAWLEDKGDSLGTPRFDEHNGQSAKRRAMETERKRLEREAEKAAAEAAKAATSSGHLSASNADAERTREEKRREEKQEEKTSGSDEPAGFSKFWNSWPSGGRKGGRAKCLGIWKAKRLESETASVVAHVEAMKLSADWVKDRGQFVPAPASYLNKQAWDGADFHESRLEPMFEGGI